MKENITPAVQSASLPLLLNSIFTPEKYNEHSRNLRRGGEGGDEVTWSPLSHKMSFEPK